MSSMTIGLAVPLALALGTAISTTVFNMYEAHNAALRGECRINQASAYHFHHQNSLQTKNATRHESLLNALLCLRLKGLSFTIPRA